MSVIFRDRNKDRTNQTASKFILRKEDTQGHLYTAIQNITINFTHKTDC